MYDRGENYVRKKSEKGRYPAGPTIKVDKFHREIKKIHREQGDSRSRIDLIFCIECSSLNTKGTFGDQ